MHNTTMVIHLHSVMAKVGTCILILFYLVVNSHSVINLHYCCNHLVSWAWNADAENCGGKGCNKKNCCDDVSLTIAVSDEHASPATQQAELPLIVAMDMELASLEAPNIATTCCTSVAGVSHAPPNLALRKIYLLCEVFRL